MTATGFSGRFWAKVTPEPNTGCWLWTGAVARGYGTLGLRGRRVYAHRLAYEMERGPIPAGLHIDHLCRVPLCLNPSHLEAVTCKENVRRGLVVGRTDNRGELSGLAKLTEVQARAILADPRQQKLVAAEYGVSRATVSQIKSGGRWGHLAARAGDVR